MLTGKKTKRLKKELEILIIPQSIDYNLSYLLYHFHLFLIPICTYILKKHTWFF